MFLQVQHPPEPPQVHFLCPSRPSTQIHCIPPRDNGRSPQSSIHPCSSFPKNSAPTLNRTRKGQIPLPLCARVCNKSLRIHSPALHKNPLCLGSAAQESFDEFKQALASAPLLSAPDFNREFILYVSASKNSIAGVLV